MKEGIVSRTQISATDAKKFNDIIYTRAKDEIEELKNWEIRSHQKARSHLVRNVS